MKRVNEITSLCWPKCLFVHQLVWYWKQLLIAMCTFRQYPRLWSQGETFESFVICWRRWFGSFSEASHFDQSVQTQSCCHCPYLFRTVGTVGLGAISPPDFDQDESKTFCFKSLGLLLAPPDFQGFLRPWILYLVAVALVSGWFVRTHLRSHETVVWHYENKLTFFPAQNMAFIHCAMSMSSHI